MINGKCNKSIKFRLRGGLGNQLFQLAAASFFSLKLDANVILQDSAIIRHRDKSRRSWLRKLNIEDIVPSGQIEWECRLRSLAASTRFYVPKLRNVLDEKQLIDIDFLKETIEVEDFFISRDYAQCLTPTIVPVRQSVISNYVSKVAEAIKMSEYSAALHLRLGDFRKTKAGILPAEYYFEGLKQLRSFGVRKVDCFSDEIVGAQVYLKSFGNLIEINFPEASRLHNPIELLYTLSKYHFFISSNSTLSWWASYLNKRPDAKIYCNWNDNLYIEKWHKLE